jgi:hypothetical protein
MCGALQFRVGYSNTEKEMLAWTIPINIEEGCVGLSSGGSDIVILKKKC